MRYRGVEIHLNHYRVAYSRNDWFHIVDRYGNTLDFGMDTRKEAQELADRYNAMEREGMEYRDEVIGS